MLRLVLRVELDGDDSADPDPIIIGIISCVWALSISNETIRTSLFLSIRFCIKLLTGGDAVIIIIFVVEEDRRRTGMVLRFCLFVAAVTIVKEVLYCVLVVNVMNAKGDANTNTKCTQVHKYRSAFRLVSQKTKPRTRHHTSLCLAGTKRV